MNTMHAKYGLGTALLLIGVLLTGCDSEKTAQARSASSDSKAGGTSTTTGGGAPGTSTTGSSTNSSKPAVSLSQVPESLKSEAYHYYGLGYDKPLHMSIDVPGLDGKPDHETGSQTTTLKSIENGTPIFKIERTGYFANFGEQEISLKPDGLYNTASTIAKVGAHDLEMPAKLAPGTTWHTHTEIPGSKEVIDDSQWKVVGMQKVKTPTGEQDALLITSSGKATIAGKPSKTTSQNWFVKDIGAVKQVLETTDEKGKKTRITIEESK